MQNIQHAISCLEDLKISSLGRSTGYIANMQRHESEIDNLHDSIENILYYAELLKTEKAYLKRINDRIEVLNSVL